MIDHERLQPRTFSGLLDSEWTQFDLLVRSWLGRGKRSLFLCILVRKTLECHKRSEEHQAMTEQRADHAVFDTLKSVVGKRI